MGKYYTILYKGLEHLQILVSAGIPEVNSLQIPGKDFPILLFFT
jgi:hypothetical protein